MRSARKPDLRGMLGEIRGASKDLLRQCSDFGRVEIFCPEDTVWAYLDIEGMPRRFVACDSGDIVVAPGLYSVGGQSGEGFISAESVHLSAGETVLVRLSKVRLVGTFFFQGSILFGLVVPEDRRIPSMITVPGISAGLGLYFHSDGRQRWLISAEWSTMSPPGAIGGDPYAHPPTHWFVCCGHTLKAGLGYDRLIHPWMLANLDAMMGAEQAWGVGVVGQPPWGLNIAVRGMLKLLPVSNKLISLGGIGVELGRSFFFEDKVYWAEQYSLERWQFLLMINLTTLGGGKDAL